MNSNEMKHVTFENATYDKWKAKAESALKGKSIDTLHTHTYEKTILKPLYSESDVVFAAEFPSLGDQRRGSKPLGYITSSWRVAQRLSYSSLEQLKSKLEDALNKGQSAISFNLENGLLSSSEELKILLGNVYTQYPFAIEEIDLKTPFLNGLMDLVDKEGGAENVTGYVGNDPIAVWAKTGDIPEDFSSFMGDWCQQLQRASKQLPHLRTVIINGSTYHNSGANAVQELAAAISTGSYYIDVFTERGIGLAEILSKFVFKFSIGSHFFMEVAKLRAARLLWSKITEAYGASIKNQNMEIAAETSLMTKSTLDHHVNILRAGNEAFAAILGGIQYLHVAPFNDLSDTTALSERLARNTQLILREEVQLAKVVDPAGGSWYIESLTNELAEKAWELFLKIDAHGGIVEALKSNLLQSEINHVRVQRIKDVTTRKRSVIGTNVYANLEENVSYDSRCLQEDLNNSRFTPLKGLRVSQAYEHLRYKAHELAHLPGKNPSMGLILLGELKDYKPRADFVKGFLSAGGVHAVMSMRDLSLEELKSFIRNAGTDFFCLCSSDEQYESIGVEIIQEVKAEFPNMKFYLAGLPHENEQQLWLDRGIQEFLHVRSNHYELLLKLLTEMGGEKA